jgi:hypothetical protein
MSISPKPGGKRKPQTAKAKPNPTVPAPDDPVTKQRLREVLVWLLAFRARRLKWLLRWLDWPMDDMPCVQLQGRLQNELRLATDYWLKTVQPYIAGRRLSNPDLYVAQDAHLRLEKARANAVRWNDLPEGKAAPIALPDLGDSKFRTPQPLYAEDFPPPEVLATIAAPLLTKQAPPLSAEDAIRCACELLSAAQQHVIGLPRRPPAAKESEADLEAALCSYVTVAEVHESNKPASRRLPLLPALRVPRKGIAPGKVTGTQTEKAILMAMEDFQKERAPEIEQKDWQRDEDQDRKLFPHRRPQTWQDWQQEWQRSIDDVKGSRRLSLLALCQLRWERFRRQSDRQSEVATKRELVKRQSERVRNQ